MPDDPQYEREFSPGFLRKVLSLCVRTGLHRRVPGAALPAHFTGAAGDGKRRSPRQRIAELVERHGEKDPKGWPGLETMDMLVDQEAARHGPDEARALRDEWAEVRGVEVSDAQYVEGEVREWMDRLGVQRVILAAADLYQAGATGSEVRQHLLKSLRESSAATEGRTVSLVDTWRERMLEWERGDDAADRVPTGLRKLDLALGGGVRRGELFFFLAPPKGAKTAAQINVALNGARRRFGAAVFSFEMSERPMTMRMDRNVTHSTRAELRAEPSRVERAFRGWVAAGAGDVFVTTDMPVGQSSVDFIERKVESLRREGRVVDEVVADFLNIMAPTGGGGDDRRHDLVLARVAREMHQAARNLGVAWWSAALVKRDAVAKPRLKKGDIAQVFEAVAIAHGVIGICAPEELVLQGLRNLYVTALRDEEEDKTAGIVEFDGDRMVFRDVDLSAYPAVGPGGEPVGDQG